MKWSYTILFILFFCACKDKYTPNIKNPVSGFLIVEGFINSSGDTTRITLSRSSGLDTIQVIYEKGAKLEIQAENGSGYPLEETSAGIYYIGSIPIDASQKYRLHIETSDAKEYLSDYSEVKFSPPIDSVNWVAGPELVSVYVSTHDDTGNSIYYEWSFTETWKYTAAFISDLVYVPPVSFIPRIDGGKYNTCYITKESSEILTGSSAKLKADVIYQNPLSRISYFSSNRLYNRYSMLVKQTVLTKDAYDWKQKLKKNTEEIGSIFDPQPSQTGGNIHCLTNPTERVVGFIWCSSQTEKRIFINRGELPDVRIPSGYDDCVADTVDLNAASLAAHFGEGTELPLNFYTKPSMTQVMLGGGIACIDCRMQGGTIVKPDFW